MQYDCPLACESKGWKNITTQTNKGIIKWICHKNRFCGCYNEA